MSGRDEVKQVTLDRARRDAQAWLDEHGLVVAGESAGDRMRRLAHWREQLREQPVPKGLDWARRVVAGYRAGERIEPSVVEAAFEALGIREPVLRRVNAPRPDGRDRQAGDTDFEGV